jgi:nitrogen regulatory protein P-II 1
MKLVTAVIKPHKLDEVKEALRAYGIKGKTEVYRGTEYTVDIVPKARVEVLCDIDDAADVAAVIASAARTGRIGDGKVWVSEVDPVIRIRTGEVGDAAL